MKSIGRREFIASITASALPLQAATLRTIGVQLYTVRSVIGERPLETLKALEQIGFREVEVVQGNMAKIWSDLKQTSLKPVSLHMDTALFTRDQAKLPAALDDANPRLSPAAQRTVPLAFASIATFAAKSLARTAASRKYHLLYNAPHWRVGWRHDEGAYLIDVFTPLSQDVDAMVGSDGLHLTEAGYRRMAETIFAALRDDLDIK